jgi:hypothetical protein
LVKRCETSLCFGVVRGEVHEHADAPHALTLLCARRQRPSRRRAAEQRDELAAPHVGPPPPESVYGAFSLP